MLMAWCFSTRASVATVLTTHPCVPRRLGVKPNNTVTSTSNQTITYSTHHYHCCHFHWPLWLLWISLSYFFYYHHQLRLLLRYSQMWHSSWLEKLFFPLWKVSLSYMTIRTEDHISQRTACTYPPIYRHSNDMWMGSIIHCWIYTWKQ